MTSNIAQAFEAARAQGRAAFIPYVTGNFPDAQICLQLIQALDKSGADIIEVGLPFSDPLADGPAIQKSSKIALDNGATPASVLETVSQAAAVVKAPLVLMTYLNPVLKMGYEAFAQRAARAGVAGVIVPDLPPEEAGPWVKAARKAGLDTIFMAAPTTTPRRLKTILEFSRGFLYYVSLTGVTGSDLETKDDLLNDIKQLRENSSIPVAVGFGVARPDQAARLAEAADGVIVGSALVKKMLGNKGTTANIEAAAVLAVKISRALAG